MRMCCRTNEAGSCSSGMTPPREPALTNPACISGPLRALQWAARRGGSPLRFAAAVTRVRRYSRAWSSISTRMSWRSCAAPTCRRVAAGQETGACRSTAGAGQRAKFGRRHACHVVHTFLLSWRICAHPRLAQTTNEYDTFGSTAAELARRAAADAAAERPSGGSMHTCTHPATCRLQCQQACQHVQRLVPGIVRPRITMMPMPMLMLLALAPPSLPCSNSGPDARGDGGACSRERGHPPAAEDGLAPGQGHRCVCQAMPAVPR